MYKNGLIRKLWLISKFLTSQTGQQIITIRTLPKVSRRKGKQKTKFDQLIEYYMRNTGWPTKISLIFFGDNFYKYKETSKIFSSQILEVYRILLVETTLESYSQDLNPFDYFLRGYLKDRVCENNPQTREDIIWKEIRRIPQEMLNRFVDNFNVRVAAVLSYSSAVHGMNIVLITEKV